MIPGKMDHAKPRLAHVPHDRFHGRAAVLERLAAHAGRGGILAVRYAPLSGGPELLRQLCDLLVDRDIAVGYVSVTDNSSLEQIHHRIEAGREESVVIIDGIHHVAESRELVQRLSARGGAVFLAGLRRCSSLDGLDSVHVEPLELTAAAGIAEDCAAEFGLSLNDETRDLLCLQLGARPGFIRSVLKAAAARQLGVTSFASLERVYTDELFGISIGKAIDALLCRVVPDIEVEAKVFRFLCETLENGPTRVAELIARTGIAPGEVRRILGILHSHEIANVGAGFIHMDSDDIVLADYIRGRSRLEIEGRPRAFVIAETIAANIERAPKLMSRQYRRQASIGLKDLMARLQGQRVAAASLDYAGFAGEIKGLAPDEQVAKLVVTDDRIQLPEIVFTANTAYVYPPFRGIADRERSAIGYAVDGTVWLAAEIDSKLEAPADMTEYWLDRLEAAALHCGFGSYKLWLIAREGFTKEALETLAERDAIGTSRAQAELLRSLLDPVYDTQESSGNSYEITIPMTADSEFVAAKAAEEIAGRAGFAKKQINHIKTALVEACINATEHSLSPDRRIRITFAEIAGGLEITVANRGVRLADRPVAEPEDGSDQRRGWGLQLISKLMDHVSIEPVDDGTHLVMRKALT